LQTRKIANPLNGEGLFEFAAQVGTTHREALPFAHPPLGGGERLRLLADGIPLHGRPASRLDIGSSCHHQGTRRNNDEAVRAYPLWTMVQVCNCQESDPGDAERKSACNIG